MGLKRRLVLTLPHMYAAPALIASSDMIATIMEGVVSASGHAGKLAVLKLPLQLEPVQFMMSWHRRNDTHPAQRWFRSCVLGAFSDPRSEERLVGKECVSPCRARWSPYQ